MSFRIRITLYLLLVAALAACATTQTSPTPEANMPNPASVFCEENGGTLEMRQDADGNQYGMCVFPDGSECDEWAYFRGECAPGDQLPAANMPNPASVYCEENGGTLVMRQDADGNQYGMCVFPDGSECGEWAYFRGECAPGDQAPAANMPNPASVYCEENGGTMEMRQDAEGNQYGVCVFPDGSECDEWAYFRGECAPGDVVPVTNEEAGVSITLAEDGCQLYTNDTLGYRFHFPADTQITENADPLKSFTIAGPVVDGETWPVIYIAHPNDREDFRPPVEVNLEQWLADHNLVGETRLADTQIAGVTALHWRHDRSPQSYAHDQYFFAYGGQLYSIVILHTGDKEDWELYNHFLESFEFD